MTPPVGNEAMGKMIARRRATYGSGLKTEPGKPGPYHVYDAQGNRIGQFSRVRRAKLFVDEQSTLQHRDKRNEPLGPPTSPGVVVVRGQQLVHVGAHANPRAKEFKGLLEHLGISLDSKLAPQE